MNKPISITPEMLEKINKAHVVSSGIMRNFQAQEPVAAALAKFNPVSKDDVTEAQPTQAKSSSLKIK